MPRGRGTVAKDSVLLDRARIAQFFERNLRRLYPSGTKVARLRIQDESKFTFKKAVRYHLTVVDRSGRRVTHYIRANQPSKDTRIESTVNHGAQSFLYTHGFDRPPFLVSPSFGYFPKLKIAMYEELPGVTLSSLIERRSPSALRVMGLAGRWLAAMHALTAPSTVRLRTRAQEKRETKYFLDDYKWYDPGVLPESQRIFAWWWRRRDVLMRGAKPALLHGDFNPNNILAQRDPRSVGVIDFGNAWRYDPMYDVGNALQQLGFLVWQEHAPQRYVDRLKTVFLANYRRTHPLTALDRRKLPLFQAWWAMQIMAYVVSVRHGPSDRVRNVVPLANLLLKATEA